jgi:hypothetical protein
MYKLVPQITMEADIGRASIQVLRVTASQITCRCAQHCCVYAQRAALIQLLSLEKSFVYEFVLWRY